MSYLQDRKSKNKRNLRLFLAFIFLVIFIIFRSAIFSFLSFTAQKVFKPVLVLGNNTGSGVSGFISTFRSKQSLIKENEELKMKLNEALVRNLATNSLVDENTKLKEILGRKSGGEMILGNILSKPNQSLYDVLIIDIGSSLGVEVGDEVFALGSIPIGRVAEVFETSAKVTLFSSWKEKTEVIVDGSDVFMNIVGRGGGNFEMILPRDFEIENGEEVVSPGAGPSVVATVVTVISDPRDAYKKALLISPVNIQELKFVQVRK